MQTINSGSDNEIVLLLDGVYTHYLFQFTSTLGCQPVYLLLENESGCDDYQLFTINQAFGFGAVWKMRVYGQNSNTNTDPANATLLLTEDVKILLPEDCENSFPSTQLIICPEINPSMFSCEELLTPYTGLSDETLICVLQALSCDFIKDNMTPDQVECVGKPLQEYTCDELIDPYNGLTETQEICIAQNLSCDFYISNLPQDLKDCILASYFEDEYATILEYAASQSMTLPQLLQRFQQNQIMIDRKASGDFAVDDFFYCLAVGAGCELFSLINWKNPGVFTAVPRNATTFVANMGWAGDGISGHLGSTYIPSTDAVNLQLNSARRGMWVTDRGNAGLSFAEGDTSGQHILRLASSDAQRINSGSLNAAASLTDLGFNQITRRDANNVNIYTVNQSGVINDQDRTAAATSVGNTELILGGSVGAFVNSRFAFWWGGGENYTNRNASYLALRNYLNALS